MCGISGHFLKDDGASVDAILGMTRMLGHRDPDDEGLVLMLPEKVQFHDPATAETTAGVTGSRQVDGAFRAPHRTAFGHRRFSIIDLTPAGYQSFWSQHREVCLAFNGEIYNYVELRRELEGLGRTFTTHSDTEVLAEAYLEWGEPCFQRFNGIWALSLYDTRKQVLLLARDRVGKVPLYVHSTIAVSSGLRRSKQSSKLSGRRTSLVAMESSPTL